MNKGSSMYFSKIKLLVGVTLAIFFVNSASSQVNEKVIVGEATVVQGVAMEAIEPACVTQPLDVDIFDTLANSRFRIKLNNRTFIKKLIDKQMEMRARDGIQFRDRRWAGYDKISVILDDIGCEFQGKYKLTGDGVDHFSWYRGNGGISSLGATPAGDNFHSIKIKLSNGSIDNIEKFKLFVPFSRYGEAEVIASTLFRELNFLAPRTAMIRINQDGIRRRVIFQEDIEKGLFEHSGVHENVFFEGDEQFGIGLPFTPPVVVNDRILSSATAIELAEKAHTQMTQIYLKSGMLSPIFDPAIDRNVYEIDPVVNPDFFPRHSREEMILFSLLSYSMNAIPGLSKDDSRFIFDHISRRFRPIYYDGHANIFEPLKSYTTPFYFDEENRRELIGRIDGLNRLDFYRKLTGLGVELSFSTFDQVLESVISNLRRLEAQPTVNLDLIENLPHIMSIWQDVSFSFFDGTPVFEDLQFVLATERDGLKICDRREGKLKCTVSEFANGVSPNVRKAFLTQKLQSLDTRFDETIYLGVAAEAEEQDIWGEREFSHEDLPGVLFILGADASVEVDSDARVLTFFSASESSFDNQVAIRGGNLTDWKIRFGDDTALGYPFNQGSRLSHKYRTGCLTISDAYLKNVDIKLENSHCEDGIHMVRVDGTNVSLSIAGAASDAIDADFSNIDFANVFVARAGNDCIDFSAGQYRIAYSKLEDCGDKAVSSGEKSKTTIAVAEISGSTMGVVAKDSSVVSVGQYSIEDTNVCFAAYRKKREFLGGVINAGVGNCAHANTAVNSFEQQGSKINMGAGAAQ